MAQVVCYALVFRKVCKVILLDFQPCLGPALGCMSSLLLRGHVRPADPVFVLCLPLQVLYRVAFHLPRDWPLTAILPNPLLSRDAFPQQRKGQEHFVKSVPGFIFTATKI